MEKILQLMVCICLVVGPMLGITSCDKDVSNLSPQTGAGGSMARFAISGNTLYIVSKENLEVYNIASGGNPVKDVSARVGVGIETIFPYGNNLFIGASNGMYIYDLRIPGDPALLSSYSHVQSCDPVVVQGQYAYVTLRAGTTCRLGNSLSSLDVVDISNLTQPKLVDSQILDTQYGLGVSGKKLFVCDGDFGLKVMDITNPAKPVLKQRYKDLISYDVIALDSHLILTGKNGLFQYQFDDNDKMELLSKIPVL